MLQWIKVLCPVPTLINPDLVNMKLILLPKESSFCYLQNPFISKIYLLITKVSHQQ